MALFKPAENMMAYAKVGLLGFAGSGKTRTAWEIARGLHAAIASKKPIAMLDTETGSDFLIPLAKEAKIEMVVSKTRAFKDLQEGIREAEGIADILLIDSVSHFWVDLVESYKKKKNVNRLAFQDWGILKPMWQDFSTWFVTSKVHCIVAGRAGFEYDYFEGDDGKMELYKTGTKMKAEGEFGFEPSLLIEMERIKNPEATDEYRKAKSKTDKDRAVKAIREERQWVRRAYVLKDRADVLDGKYFDNPTYVDFSPHWKFLNIGGEHQPIQAGDSQSIFDHEGKPDWKREQEQKKIALDTIQGWLTTYFPGSTASEKKAKLAILKYIWGKPSWEYVCSLHNSEVQLGMMRIENILKQQENISILLGEVEGKIVENIPVNPPEEDDIPLNLGKGAQA